MLWGAREPCARREKSMSLDGRQSVRLVIAGDVGVRRADPPSIFAGVVDRLRAGDVTLVNQEWTLNDRGTPWPGKTGKMIGSSPDAVKALTFGGVDVVGLANNHMLNYSA